jgi:transposase
MPVMHERCAGLDGPKQTVVAWVPIPHGEGDWHQETRTFGTMTVDLLALSDGLLACGCTHVALERTGAYWKPVFNLLEGACEVWLVNAQHVQAVPGRQTEVKDAAWLAELLQHGRWRASCIPPAAQRDRRDLTRDRRPFMQERVPLITRVPKLWEEAHIKVAAVASDSRGGSGRARLAALVAGHTAPHVFAEWATGRLRSQREPLAQALEGRV